MPNKTKLYNVKKNLQSKAGIYSKVLGQMAREFAPKHLRPVIKVTYDKENGTFTLKISDVAKYGRKYGDAYGREQGAGVWKGAGGLGGGDTYVIRPKNSQVLVFPWEKADRGALHANISGRLRKAAYQGYPLKEARRDGSKFYGFAGSSKKFQLLPSSASLLMFNYVEHPGYQAANAGVGYLQPAVANVYAMIEEDFDRGQISANLRNSIVEHVENMFLFKVGKNVSFKIYGDAKYIQEKQMVYIRGLGSHATKNPLGINRP